MSELNKSPIPLYYQIAQILQDEFLTEYRPGSQVPTEPELIERFGVSRITIRRAMELLEEIGILNRQPGRGTFLTTVPKIQVELSELTGFVEDMIALGLESSAQVVSIKTITPGPPITSKLDLPSGAEVVYIERIRLAEEEPISFDVTYLPHEVGIKIAQDDLVIDPIFYLLEEKYGIALSEADYNIEARGAPKTVAHYLEIKLGSPIFLIERTSYSTDHKPIDYEKLHYRADKISYHMRLTRRSPSLKKKFK